MVSMAACYQWGPGFKSWQRREFINFWLKRKFNKVRAWFVMFNMCVMMIEILVSIHYLQCNITHVCGQQVIAESYYIANNYYVTMLKAGFEPTEVGVTSLQLNAKRMLCLQATTAGFWRSCFEIKFWHSRFGARIQLTCDISHPTQSDAHPETILT